MSPKNIYNILRDFVEEIPISSLKDAKILVDGNAMAYFAFINARKLYHENTFCLEAAQKAARDPRDHEKKVGTFSVKFCVSCFKTLTSIIPNHTIVFDGKEIPPEKEKEFGRRNKRSLQELESLTVSLDLFKKNIESEQYAKKFYESLACCHSLARCHTFNMKIINSLLKNIPSHIVAQGEADRYCAKACASGIYQAVLSPDYDVLMYHCPLLIRDITEKTASVILLETVLQGLDITFSQFVDVGILMGNDYNDRINNIGPKRSLQLVKKYGSLENIELYFQPDLKCINWRRLRKIFQ